MKKYFTKKNIAGFLFLIFLVIQMIRVDHSRPEVIPSKDFLVMTQAPDDIQRLIRSACYDCHSHEYKVPWYGQVAPVSWWIKSHMDHGVQSLNFSLWADYDEAKKAHKLDENIDMMKKHWMPIVTYKWMHSEGRLSDDQYERLAVFFATEKSKIN